MGRRGDLFPPFPDRLTEAMLDLGLIVWPGDDTAGPLRSLGQQWPATVTGSPAFGVPAREPIGRAITWPGGSVYASAGASVPVPTSAMSVVAVFSTSDASTPANRILAGRGAASQHSWRLTLASNQRIAFEVMQSAGSSHCSAAAVLAANDGAWHLASGTFDGTTLNTRVDDVTGTSTTLVGSWHTASTGSVQIAAYGGGSPFIGSIGRVGYTPSRSLTAADHLSLLSIVRGG